MEFFKVKLKEEFPFLTTKQDPELTCYINDNYKSVRENRLNPAILIIPGGAYFNVSMRREGESMAFKYLSKGFNVFVLNYSVHPECYPTQFYEAACAIKYIRTNAAKWNVDPNKVAVNGYSAGGHLAASLGVWWDDEDMLKALNANKENIRPDALILSYPVISADPKISHMGSINNVSGTIDTEAPIYKKMSLENHVNANTPPTFIWHTFEDQVVPVQNSLKFAYALAENKVLFEQHIYPYGQHGLATSDYASNDITQDHYSAPWIQDSIKFLYSLWYK